MPLALAKVGYGNTYIGPTGAGHEDFGTQLVIGPFLGNQEDIDVNLVGVPFDFGSLCGC